MRCYTAYIFSCLNNFSLIIIKSIIKFKEVFFFFHVVSEAFVGTTTPRVKQRYFEGTPNAFAIEVLMTNNQKARFFINLYTKNVIFKLLLIKNIENFNPTLTIV